MLFVHCATKRLLLNSSKMRIFEKAVLLVLLWATARGAEDYCRFCSNHVACNNNGSFHPRCSPDASTTFFTQDLIDLVLTLHNKLRDLVAGGKVPGLQPATRMASMTWDPELAYLAELNTKTCLYDHDNCRQTLEFPYAGQNIAAIESFNGYLNDNFIIINRTLQWFNEYKWTSMDIINSYQLPDPIPFPLKDHGHFTQIVSQYSYKVGCAISKYMVGELYTCFLVCNYGVTNIINGTVYTAGPSASACQTGTHPTYTNLCSENETYAGRRFQRNGVNV